MTTNTGKAIDSVRWERSRNRYGLWDGSTRLAYIGKEHGRNWWHWSIDVEPYTCGMACSSKEAKREVLAELKRGIQE